MLPLTLMAQTSRITALQGARNLVVSDGQTSSYHMLKSGESMMIYRKNGQLTLDDQTIDPAKTTLRVQSVARFALDEDSTAFGGDYAIMGGLLAFRRDLNVGKWNSLVVPFSMTGYQVIDAFGEGTLLASLERVTDGNEPTVEFQAVNLETNETVITANLHYLIKPTRDPDIAIGSQTSVVYGKAKVSGPVYAIGGVTMETKQTPKYTSIRSEDKANTIRVRGFYYARNLQLSNNPRYLLGDDDHFYQQTEALSIKAFRSYYENASDDSQKALRFYVSGVSEDLSPATTAIAGVSLSGKGSLPSAVYNLQGRRVERPTQKGLYIIDGRKVMIK